MRSDVNVLFNSCLKAAARASSRVAKRCSCPGGDGRSLAACQREELST